MAYNEALAERIRHMVRERHDIHEKKMFGGIGFLLNGNMLVGVWKNSLIARLGPDHGEAALQEPHVKAFDITGKPMRGWVLIDPDGIDEDDQLKNWIQRAVDFVEGLPNK